jgi:alpha-tubulin suppressor-like RCC1 family protein
MFIGEFLFKVCLILLLQAAIGGWHCLAADDKGRAYAWGKQSYNLFESMF